MSVDDIRKMLGNVYDDGRTTYNENKAAGEVFTPMWCVENMIELGGEQCKNISAKTLDPCTGTGNFLMGLTVYRVIDGIEKGMTPEAIMRELVNNLYAVELQESSCIYARKRMMTACKKIFKGLSGVEMSVMLECELEAVIEEHIVNADALKYDYSFEKDEVCYDF